MKNRIKELEKQLTEMVENFQPNHFKEKAYQELSKVDLTKKPATRFIINDYPDFDSICFKITQPNCFTVRIHINPDELRGNKKAIHNAAKMISHWYKNGGRKEN